MTNPITSSRVETTCRGADAAPPFRGALAGLSLSMLLSSLGTSSANVGLPAMSVAFHASFREVQWIVLAYLLAVTSLIVIAGRLGDVVGRRRLLLAGVLIFTLASAVCGLSPVLWVLLAARAAQGLGAAAMMALATALVSDAVPAARTGRVMGLLGTMSALGTALGPALGGVLVAAFGWRAVFLINVPLGILTFYLIHRHLPADSRSAIGNPPGFDVRGAVWLGLTLGTSTFAVTTGRGGFGALNAVLLLAAGCGLLFFLRAEARAGAPLLPRDMLRAPGLGSSLAMGALVATVVMATLVVGPFYLSRTLGLAAAQAGLVMCAGPLVAALTGLPAGRAVDRFGAPRTIVAGLSGIATGCLALTLLPPASGIAGYTIPLVIITTGYAVFQTANNTAVMQGGSADQRGGLSGMLNLSRNLGLITGTSVMGAVFSAASGHTAVSAADPAAIAGGMRVTFGVASALAVLAIVIALVAAAGKRVRCSRGASHAVRALAMIVSVLLTVPSGAAPALTDPYPLNAAGWGPEAGKGLFYSRWAEDWIDPKSGAPAPSWKVIPLSVESTLRLNAEARFRFDVTDNGQLVPGNDYQQALFRGIAGADLRVNPYLRLYGELGTGQVEGRRASAAANFQNDASLQQLFVDARVRIGSTLAGVMAGRQEFADGPRQLISLSDGPNMHRTWNGVRLYAHGPRWRIGAFDFRATRLESGFLDEDTDDAEFIRGVNGSFLLSSGPADSGIFLDPFWIHNANTRIHAADGTGSDERDTAGVRLWGRRGDFKFDWTLAHQTGESLSREVDAWALFAVQSISLSEKGWKPRLTSHIDVASGGHGGAPGFHQLYASSNYLGEGRFLSTSNLLLIAPGISLTPAPSVNLSVEYGFARRLSEDDAVYAGGMRAYPGTRNVSGGEIGGLLRASASWAVSKRLTLFLNYEHLEAGEVLQRAGLASGSYGYIGATLRF